MFYAPGETEPLPIHGTAEAQPHFFHDQDTVLWGMKKTLYVPAPASRQLLSRGFRRGSERCGFWGAGRWWSRARDGTGRGTRTPAASRARAPPTSRALTCRPSRNHRLPVSLSLRRRILVPPPQFTHASLAHKGQRLRRIRRMNTLGHRFLIYTFTSRPCCRLAVLAWLAGWLDLLGLAGRRGIVDGMHRRYTRAPRESGLPNEQAAG